MPIDSAVRPPNYSCYAELSLDLRLGLQPRCSACFVTMITILVDRSRAILCRLPWLHPWWSGIGIESTLLKESVRRKGLVAHETDVLLAHRVMNDIEKATWYV